VNILVLGGGIAGVTAAYYLGKDGHAVTLLEANEGLGLEATAGNAGIIAPGHSFAWGSPKAPGMLWRSLLGQETAIRMRLKPDLRLYAWGLRFLRECTAERARHNTLIKLRLCQYSARLLDEIAHAERIDYQAVRRGALYLYRDPALFEAGIQKMKLLADRGQKQEVLDGAGVARLDPAFEPVKGKVAGAIRDVGDSSGDSRIFVEHLARLCREKFGAAFETGTRVTALRADGGRVRAVATDRGERTADLYVLALGVEAPIVARSIGLRLAVYPAKGYSSTFPIRHGGLTPTVPGVDEQWLVGWSRLGDRLRLTSTAEFAGYDRTWTPRDFNNILRFAKDIFPDAAHWDRGEYRACLRPMTPDGRPLVGRGRYDNLVYNCGHGHMGWTMACGTARIVSDLVAGRTPEIDIAGLTPRREVGGY
jgi:D-amino-acid dehydrogenase